MEKTVLFIQGGGAGAHAADQKLSASSLSLLLTGGRKHGSTQTSYGKILLPGPRKIRPFSSTIVATMKSCRLPTWRCMPKSCLKPPFENSIGAAINFKTTCQKSQPIFLASKGIFINYPKLNIGASLHLALQSGGSQG
jgi:hypothetical protein